VKKLPSWAFRAAFSCAFAVPAAAADSAKEMAAPPPEQALVYTGFDFNSQGSYTGFVGGNFAPGGDLETSGARFSVFDAAGVYRYDTTLGTTQTKIKGRFETVDILLGYGANADNFSAKFMAGLNIQDQALSPGDPNNPVQGIQAGVKVQTDVYATPTPQTMIFGLGSYSTAFRTYFSELKAGYQVLNIRELYIGPQFIAQGNQQYDQWRVGAHLTGIKFGAAELILAGGYMQDSRNGPGTYGLVTLDLHF
jgi:cellulose biosynthesis protein BcsS